MAEGVHYSGGQLVNEKGLIVAPTTEGGQSISFWIGTQQSYDALPTKKANAVYLIVG